MNRSEAKDLARKLRLEGYGYRSIANRVGIKWSTIRNWTFDIPIDKEKAYRMALDDKKSSSLATRTSKSGRRSYLIHTRGHKCESCQLGEWLSKPIALEVHHVDGNNCNNTEDNLKLLCPNCHAQTDTWRRRNKPIW